MGTRLQRLKARPERNGGIDLLPKILSQMVQRKFVQRRRFALHIRLVDQVDRALFLQTVKTGYQQQQKQQQKDRNIVTVVKNR